MTLTIIEDNDNGYSNLFCSTAKDSIEPPALLVVFKEPPMYLYNQVGGINALSPTTSTCRSAYGGST